jgi:hypothetical protein
MVGYYEPGANWLRFAAVMLAFAGTFNVIHGIVAISKGSYFEQNAEYVFSDLDTWGWIILILGVAQIVAGLAILGKREWARWFGIAVAGLNGIGQLLVVEAQPFWSLAVFSLDVLVIYGLTVYGGSRVAGTR